MERVIVDVHREQARSYRVRCQAARLRSNCRSQLAGDGIKRATFNQIERVIVNDHRKQACSYRPCHAIGIRGSAAAQFPPTGLTSPTPAGPSPSCAASGRAVIARGTGGAHHESEAR